MSVNTNADCPVRFCGIRHALSTPEINVHITAMSASIAEPYRSSIWEPKSKMNIELIRSDSQEKLPNRCVKRRMYSAIDAKLKGLSLAPLPWLVNASAIRFPLNAILSKRKIKSIANTSEREKGAL